MHISSVHAILLAVVSQKRHNASIPNIFIPKGLFSNTFALIHIISITEEMPYCKLMQPSRVCDCKVLAHIKVSADYEIFFASHSVHSVREPSWTAQC